MKQVVKALHHRDPRSIGGLGDPLGLGPVAGERLFGENRLARRDRRQIPRGVQDIGQRVVHDVDLGIVDNVGVARQNTFHTVLFGERLRALGIARCHRNEPVTKLVGGPDDGQLGDPGCAQHPDPQGHARSTSRR